MVNHSQYSQQLKENDDLYPHRLHLHQGDVKPSYEITNT